MHIRTDIYIVDFASSDDFIKCKIIDDETLIDGGTYYTTDNDFKDIVTAMSRQCYYRKLLGDTFWSVYSHDQIKSIDIDLFSHHYRIVPMED